VRYYFAINIKANIGENLAYANENPMKIMMKIGLGLTLSHQTIWQAIWSKINWLFKDKLAANPVGVTIGG
jgi:hypothetical protein